MIAFREVEDADPALAFSPLVRGIEKTFAWIGEHGGIPLTPTKALKRAFMHWAASEFDRPGHTEADLFAVNKVLNEPDFAPLMVLHDLMIAMKLGRHNKGEFRLTKAGQALVGHPGRIFGTVVPFLLFHLNHASMSRFDDAPILSDRLHHILQHVPESRWDVPHVVAVGITSPSQSMNAALTAEGLALDLTETAVLFCPLYAVTSKDRSRAQEVCRASYTVAA